MVVTMLPGIPAAFSTALSAELSARLQQTSGRHQPQALSLFLDDDVVDEVVLELAVGEFASEPPRSRPSRPGCRRCAGGAASAVPPPVWTTPLISYRPRLM
jgi:hypothetical protein